MSLIKKHKVAAGELMFYQHSSQLNACPMQFSIFIPPQQNPQQQFPVLYWLSGLSSTEENFMQKAGAHKLAAQLGIVVVAPDTSPRGAGVADDPKQAYDLGLGAGFYVNATQEPWRNHYRMYAYIVDELPELIAQHFPVNEHKAISGHSMGGHGALTIGLKNPAAYTSISAFSPIANPINSPWGIKAFNAYLGSDQEAWKNYDSCELISKARSQLPILIDQGTADEFLHSQLKPQNLEAAARAAKYPINLRMHAGYDHSYYFIASFIEEHLRFHATYLTDVAAPDT